MKMRIKLLGKYYTFTRTYLRKNEGDCDPPVVPGKQIRICTTMRGKPELEVILHELLHACDFTKNEDWVEQAAHDIANILWRLGYGKDDHTPPAK